MVAVLQCIFIMTIQLIICSQNTIQANLLPHPSSNSAMTYSADTTHIPELAADRLGRIKWENIAFVGFQVRQWDTGGGTVTLTYHGPLL
jgi:hypothetical protein